VTKRFYLSSGWVVAKATELLRKDARSKLAKISSDNWDYLSRKEAERMRASSLQVPKQDFQKHDFSADVFAKRQEAFLEKKNPSTPIIQQVAQTRPSIAIELDPETFEWYCAEWCVYLGHKNVRVTRSTKDGGIDIHGDGFIAQVKFQEIPVGVKAIRELAGLVSVRTRALGYFFTVNGYSPQALVEGKELGLALFTLRPFKSEIIANSDLAALVLEDIELTS
jgi:HJR/Mrr/RecB family endonuclease